MAICTPLFLNVNIEFHKMNLSNNGLKYSSISNCDETRAIGNNNDILYSILRVVKIIVISCLK